MKTEITELLGIEEPIIQGGMAWVAEYHLAAAVSEAGGFGIIGAASAPPEVVREQIHKVRELTDKPFGVNLMLMNPECDKMAELLVREGVPVVTTGAGSPSKYMEMWKAAGIKVAPVVSGAALARRLEQAGADLLIAEGCESGGHIGELTTMALVPQVVDAVQLPVVAAGGIADSRQLLAAFALGAVGAQLGTCLLVSEECPIHANYKEAVLKARDNSTTVTGRIAGAPVRILKNAMTRDYLKLEKSGAELLELEKFTLGGLRRAVFDGDVQRGSLMAGQVAGLLKEIKPLRQIFEELMAGLPAVAQGLTDKKII